MRLAQTPQPRMPVTIAPFKWAPFVIAALLSTLSFGALTGAIDLWHLHISQQAVPIDHNRGHAFAQVFGFMWLFTLGMSLHLTPRFLGGAPCSSKQLRGFTWVAIPGVALMIVGRLGSIVPSSGFIGLVGSLLVAIGAGLWIAWIASMWRKGMFFGDPLNAFVATGTLWWGIAGGILFLWHVGQVIGGPLASIQIEVVWASALYGGTLSWILGILLRAGLCTLQIGRPTLLSQWSAFALWQLATLASVLTAYTFAPWARVLAGATVFIAAIAVWMAFRPFSGTGLSSAATLAPRAVQCGFIFLAITGILSLLGSFESLNMLSSLTRLRDATRHALTIGTASCFVFGFAGRMVPGFSGVQIKWPSLYDGGVALLVAGAFMRLSEIFGTQRWTLAISGVSGVVVLIGLVSMSCSLLATISVGIKQHQRTNRACAEAIA